MKVEGIVVWSAIKNDQIVIKLILLIRSTPHEQDETKHSIMSVAESNINLYVDPRGIPWNSPDPGTTMFDLRQSQQNQSIYQHASSLQASCII